MIELRHNTVQNVTVGPVLNKITRLADPLIPIYGALLSQCTWAYLIRASGSSVAIGARTWYDVPNVAGFYTFTMAPSDVNTLGSLFLFVYREGIWERPVVMEFSVISQNMWDAKYSTNLLAVEPPAQKG